MVRKRINSRCRWHCMQQRISLIPCSADSFARPDFCPIRAPFNGYDEPERNYRTGKIPPVNSSPLPLLAAWSLVANRLILTLLLADYKAPDRPQLANPSTSA